MSSLHFLYGRAAQDDAVSDNPLTHHEIMRLVVPFSERGYRVDPTASDRARRRLSFRPVTVAAAPGRHPPLDVVLRLELPDRGPTRVVRRIRTKQGLEATAIAEGGEPATLLAALERIEVTRQMCTVQGVLLARSYRVSSGRSALTGTGTADGAPVVRIVGGEARFGDVTLRATEGLSRAPFDVELAAEDGKRLDIPQDFLAVLGWQWRPLRAGRHAWRGSVKLPPREPARTEALESILDTTVTHVAETLKQPPQQFHPQHRRARWRVAFQRVLPMLSGSALLIGLVVLALLLPKTQLVHVALLHVPPLMMIAFFMQNEMPTMEIPPLPRQLRQMQWCSDASPATRRGVN
jgi:hypothetical protein